MKAKRKRAATAFNAALSQAPASPLSRNSNLDGRTEYREDAQRSKFSDREMFGSHSGHKVPSNLTKNRISHVKIVLTPADLYDVEFFHIRGTNAPKSISKHEGVYAEQLQQLFTGSTGLAVSL